MKGNFQIIFIVIFLAAAIFSLLVFAGVVKIGNDKTQSGPKGTLVLWGTASSSDIFKVLKDFNDNSGKNFTLTYVQKYPDTFNNDLVEALASGTGPDLFFLTDDLLWSYRKRILQIPYSTYPVASYKKNFVSAGEVFLTPTGIMAFPISVDPLVMYYNRNMLDAEGVVYPPATWDELSAMVPTFTEKDDSKKISKSTVALGQFSNVTHAKDIIASLFMQVGNPITTEKNGSYVSVMSSTSLGNLADVLDFYTAFADPLKEVYSWNKSLPSSVDAFSAEDLAFYFGYASELKQLQFKNPNQNFLVSPLPQTKGMNFKLTGARVAGIAVSAFSKNTINAFTAASEIATGQYASQFAEATGGVPMRRDLIAAAKPTDAYTPTFYASALFARSWLDPSPKDTNTVFQQMIESILANTFSSREALRDAENKMDKLLNK